MNMKKIEDLMTFFPEIKSEMNEVNALIDKGYEIFHKQIVENESSIDGETIYDLVVSLVKWED